MLLHKTSNHAKFCGDRLKNTGDICDRKFVHPEKVGESSPKHFSGCYPLRPPIMPHFIEIGQTNLEIRGCQLGLGPNFFFYSVTDGQKRDYLSRDSQRARGAINN